MANKKDNENVQAPDTQAPDTQAPDTQMSPEEILAKVLAEAKAAEENRKKVEAMMEELKAEREAFEKEKASLAETNKPTPIVNGQPVRKRIPLDMSEKVTINIHQGKGDPDYIFVRVNGRRYQVELGTDVEVPKYVAKQIEQMQYIMKENRRREKERKEAFDALVNAITK